MTPDAPDPDVCPREGGETSVRHPARLRVRVAVQSLRLRVVVKKENAIMDLVEKQMKRDREELLDPEARRKKFKQTYQRLFHPDKLGQIETLAELANEVSQGIAQKKDWYLS